jgi:hypothetical protein
MEKIQIGIYDHLTGENIVRDATDEEIAELEAERAASQAADDEAVAKAEQDAAAKQAILDRLGLTAEEAALLLG